MAYIGRQLARGENKLFDDISSSFNGSTTVFNLTVSSVATSTATPFQLFVSLGGVMQKPNTDFTTAGNQITFTTAPAAGLSCWIMMQGDTVDQAAIPDSSVTPSKIAGSGDFAFPADVRLKDADGSNYVGFQAPTTVSSNVVWTLPAADTGVSGYVLSSNGSGVLSWVESGDNSSPSFTGDVTLTDDGALVGTSSFNATYTGSVKTYTVTVASKSAAHRYNGSGSGSGYKINGKESPFLTLTPGRTYKFDQADGSNSGHPLRFYLEANKTTAYTTGVTTNGTAGNAGAYTQIVVSDTTPQVLHYQCSAHALMGNAVQTNSNVAAAGSLNGSTLASSVTASSLTSVGTLGSLAVTNNVTVGGNFTVSGTTTTVDSVTLSVKDKNIEMGVVSSPSDTTADGGGITLKGASDHTFNWINATDAWTSSEHIHLLDNKKLFVGGVSGTTDGLEIYHDSNNSFIKDSGTGGLFIQGSGGGAGITLEDPDGNNFIVCIDEGTGGTVELYKGGSKKLETTTGGINVTGAISVNGAALASGNTFTAVANGAIANNKAVKLDLDGKVSEIAATTVADSSPSISTNLSTNGSYVTGANEDPEDVKCIWIGNNKMLITWIKDNFPSGGKQGVKGVVGSWVDSGAVGYYSNWGAEFTLVNNTRRLKYDVCWDETNDTIIVSYVDEDDSGKGKSVYVKRSGTTLSFISSGTTPVTWRSSSSTKSVRTYWDNSIQRQILTYESSSGQGHAVVAAKNSSDDSYANTYANEITNGDTIWDMFVAVCGLTSGKVIYFWNQGNANVYYRIGVVNTGNNTIAWSTDNSNNGILVATRHMYCDCAYNADKGIVSFVGRKTDTSNNAITQLAAFNNSNNSVGSWTQVGLGSSSEGMAVAYCPDAKNLHYFYMRGSSPNYWSSRAITHGTAGNAASYTISSAIDTLGTGSSTRFSHVTRITPSPGLGLITGAARGHDISNRLTSQNVGTTTQQSNLTHARHYVGYVDQAYTNGQTATIKTYGNTVTTLSGLTIGSIYYVQGNGTVANSVDSTLSFSAETPGAGLAITATTLLIKDPFLGKAG